MSSKNDGKKQPDNVKKKKQKKSNEHNNKLLKKIIIGIISVLLVIIIAALITGHIYFSDRWYINTILNQTDVEGMKLDDSISAFKNIYNNYSLTIKGRDDMSITILKDDIDLVVESDECIKEAFNKQHEQFFLFALFGSQDLEAQPVIEYSEEKFNSILDNCLLVKGSNEKPIIAPKDARAEFSDEEGLFVVKPEVEGNTLNKENFDGIATEALKILVKEIDISDENSFPDVYQKPELKAEGTDLQKKCDAYNNSVLYWFNWKMDENNTVSVVPQDVLGWYDVDEEYNVTLNEQKVKDWVEQFCLKYKTVGKTRAFTTHAGTAIQVSGGDYGWQMNYNGTVNQILEVLNADNSSKISAYIANNSEENKAALTSNFDTLYSRKALNFGEEKDYGGNYSEISITDQKVYVYQNNNLVYTANCITGYPTPERETTKGCWFVKERLRNKVLVGEGYRTPVSYWVRITWSGIGYHDATWQNWSAWSPTKYKSVGSHGCVNLSMTDVAKIYDLVSVNDPVFIY